VHYLKILEKALEKKLRTIEILKQKNEICRPFNRAIVLHRVMGSSIGEILYEYEDEVEFILEKEPT